MSRLSQVRVLPLGRQRLPESGQVVVWISDLAHFPLGSTSEDQSRQARVQARRFRQRFLLRLLLGSYLDCPGKSVRFDYGPSGKPYLTSTLVNDSRLSFNLSHSGDWMAVAISRNVEIGVDIEQRRQLPRSLALAKRFLSSAEAEWLAGFSEPARSDHFLRLWTRREALVKAMGGSVFSSLGQIQLEPVSGRVMRLPMEWPPATSWSLPALDGPEDLVIALAAPAGHLDCESIILDCNVGASKPM